MWDRQAGGFLSAGVRYVCSLAIIIRERYGKETENNGLSGAYLSCFVPHISIVGSLSNPRQELITRGRKAIHKLKPYLLPARRLPNSNHQAQHNTKQHEAA